jgi:hypothetical protein
VQHWSKGRPNLFILFTVSESERLRLKLQRKDEKIIIIYATTIVAGLLTVKLKDVLQTNILLLLTQLHLGKFVGSKK